MDHLQEAYLSVYEESLADRTRGAIQNNRLEDEQSRTQASIDRMKRQPKVTRGSAALAANRVESDVKRASSYGPQHPKPGKVGAYRIGEAVDSEGRAYRKPSTSSSGSRPTPTGSRPVVTTPSKDKDAAGQELERTNPEAAAARRRTLARSILSQSNEAVDLYDVILSHLLDEGFADNEKNAITIMANMSEAWIDEILDEAQIMSVSGPGGLKHMINPKVLKLQNAAAKEAQGRRSEEQAAKETENTERAAKARKSSIERLNAKPGADPGNYDSGYHGDDDTSDGERHYSLSRTNRSGRTRRASGR